MISSVSKWDTFFINLVEHMLANKYQGIKLVYFLLIYKHISYFWISFSNRILFQNIVLQQFPLQLGTELAFYIIQSFFSYQWWNLRLFICLFQEMGTWRTFWCDLYFLSHQDLLLGKNLEIGWQKYLTFKL